MSTDFSLSSVTGAEGCFPLDWENTESSVEERSHETFIVEFQESSASVAIPVVAFLPSVRSLFLMIRCVKESIKIPVQMSRKNRTSFQNTGSPTAVDVSCRCEHSPFLRRNPMKRTIK